MSNTWCDTCKVLVPVAEAALCSPAKRCAKIGVVHSAPASKPAEIDLDLLHCSLALKRAVSAVDQAIKALPPTVIPAVLDLLTGAQNRLVLAATELHA